MKRMFLIGLLLLLVVPTFAQQKTAYQKENISLIQLWEPKEKRVWVTWMCPYNETMKVFLSNLKDNDKEILIIKNLVI